MKRSSILLAAAMVAFAGTASAAPIDGTFNYQGRLTNSGSPFTGLADVRISLWDSAVGGLQIGVSDITTNVTVVDGLFDVDPSFGPDAFDGNERWLQIGVRIPPGVGGFVELGRQQVRGTPYAIQTRGIFVDDALNVGIGTTAPAADLHIGDATPSLLVQDASGGVLSGTKIDPSSFYRFETFHPTDGNRSSAMVDSSWGGQWQVFDREGGGFFGIVGALGNSAIAGDGFVELFSRDSGLSTVILNADGNNNEGDDNEFGFISLRSSGLSGQGGTLSIHNNDGAQTIEFLGGSSGNPGTFTLFAPNGFAAATVTDEFGSGTLRVHETTTGNDIFSVDHDTSLGGGGILQVSRNDAGTIGFDVNGNWAGTESTRVAILGASTSMTFDTSATGSSSVTLPIDAIQDTEILDEPGVASETSNGLVTLTGGVDTILSRSITCPTAGYCLVMATGQVNFSHTTGTFSSASYGVSDTLGSIPANQDVAFFLDADLPNGSYGVPATVQGVFSVSAGLNTFYFLGDEIGGSASVNDMQLSVLFVPTAYGTVTPTLLARNGENNDANAIPMLPMSGAEIRAEQLEAVAFDQNRRDTEWAEMQAMVDQLRNQVDVMQQRLDVEPRRAPVHIDENSVQSGAALGHNNAGTR